MNTVILSKPAQAYYVYSTNALSVNIDGGGYVFLPEEYTTNSTFNANIDPWGWMYEQDAIQEPVNVAELSDEETKNGLYSAKLTFNSRLEWFAVNLASQMDNGDKIAGKTVTVDVWIKTTATNLQLCCFIDDDILRTFYDITGTTGEWQQFTWDIAFTAEQVNDAKYLVFGVRNHDDSVAECYLDSFRVFCSENITETKERTYITFSPAWNSSAIVDAVSAGNGTLWVFDTGDNKNIGSEIYSVTHEDNDITRVDLFDVLPYIPEAGDEAFVLIPNDMYGDLNAFTVTLPENIISISADSSIEMGYSNCSVSLRSDVLLSRTQTTNIVHWRITIYDEANELFDGIVTAITEKGNIVSITGNGFSVFLDKVSYAGYFPASADTTFGTVMSSIFSSTLLINGQNVILDRENVISNAQAALGGIGPLDFAVEPNTMQTAISKVLGFGAYDDTYDMLFVQIWGGRTPSLKRIKRNVVDSTPDWIVHRENVIQEEVDFTIDRTETYNASFGTYSGESNGQLETARVFNVRDLIDYGRLEKNISSGDLSEGEVYLALSEGVLDRPSSEVFGSITLVGYVSGFGTGIRQPVSAVRAGDVIFIPYLQNVTNFYSVGSASGDYIVVGSTQYNTDSKTMSISPYRLPSKVEYLVGVLTVK